MNQPQTTVIIAYFVDGIWKFHKDGDGLPMEYPDTWQATLAATWLLSNTECEGVMLVERKVERVLNLDTENYEYRTVYDAIEF